MSWVKFVVPALSIIIDLRSIYDDEDATHHREAFIMQD